MLIDYQDSRSIYEQITEQYKKLILTGAILPEEQLPSVRALAVELSTNPNTVQKAYTELERQGFIYTVKGRGAFAAKSDNLRHARKEEIIDAMLALVYEAQELGMNRKEMRTALLSRMEGDEKEGKDD